MTICTGAVQMGTDGVVIDTDGWPKKGVDAFSSPATLSSIQTANIATTLGPVATTFVLKRTRMVRTGCADGLENALKRYGF